MARCNRLRRTLPVILPAGELEGAAKATPAWWGNGGWDNGWHSYWHNLVVGVHRNRR
jgi:hypothetical protein